MEPNDSHPTRWNADYAGEIHRALDASGLSLAEYARQKGLDEQRLRWWRTRLRRGVPCGGSKILELVQPKPSPGSLASLRLVCPSGHVIELSGGDPAHALAEVLRALQAAGC